MKKIIIMICIAMVSISLLVSCGEKTNEKENLSGTYTQYKYQLFSEDSASNMTSETTKTLGMELLITDEGIVDLHLVDPALTLNTGKIDDEGQITWNRNNTLMIDNPLEFIYEDNCSISTTEALKQSLDSDDITLSFIGEIYGYKSTLNLVFKKNEE